MNITVSNILFLVGFILPLLYFYKKISHSLILSPTTITIVAFGISFITVLSLYNNWYIDYHTFLLIQIFFFTFYFGFLVAPFIVLGDWHLFKQNMINYNIKAVDLTIAYLLFFLSLLLSSFFAFLLFFYYSSGDERLLLAKHLRPLSLINSVISIWSQSLWFLFFSITQNKKWLILILILLTLKFFSGAKGDFFSSFLLFCFFYLNFNLVKKMTVFCLGTCAFLGLLFNVFVLYSWDTFNILLSRILNTADIYFYAFVIGDYASLVGSYDTLMYLLHPFSSILGFKGYDYPLGAKIVETAGKELTGMGPNPQLPVLGLVLFGQNITYIALFSVLMVSIFLLSFKLAFKVLNLRKISLVVRLLLFTTLLSGSMYIFFDIGFYQFKIIEAIIGLAIYIFIEIIISSVVDIPRNGTTIPSGNLS